MPVAFKDYYATLDVSRDASGHDVKQAFRKLARQYHPDVAKDQTSAEAKFKEIHACRRAAKAGAEISMWSRGFSCPNN